jgi:hypothetical protein
VAGAVVVAAVLAGERPSSAGGAERFVAWLAAHPEIESVTVASETMPRGPFDTRFVLPRPPEHAPAFVRIGDATGTLTCLANTNRSICVRAPRSTQARVRYLRGNRTQTKLLVLLISPPERRQVFPYELVLPEQTAREGPAVAVNPRWEDRSPAPWWVFEWEGKAPYEGTPRRAMREAKTVAGVPGPDWLGDSDQFFVASTGYARALRLETRAGTSICLRTDRWTCHALPPPASLDDVHPGLPPTNSSLTQGPPSVFRVQTRSGDPAAADLVVERHWIRSQKPHTPSMEFTGTFLELLHLGPGGAYERRAVLETTYGRLTHLGSPDSGFLIANPISDRCLEVVAVGQVPAKMVAAPPGRYCLDAGGRLGRSP